MAVSSHVQIAPAEIAVPLDCLAGTLIASDDTFSGAAGPPLSHLNRLIVVVGLAVFAAAASFSVAVATMIGFGAVAATGLAAILLLIAALVSVSIGSVGALPLAASPICCIAAA